MTANQVSSSLQADTKRQGQHWLATIGERMAMPTIRTGVTLGLIAAVSIGLTGCGIESKTSKDSGNRTYLAQPVVDARLSKEDFSFHQSLQSSPTVKPFFQKTVHLVTPQGTGSRPKCKIT